MTIASRLVARGAITSASGGTSDGLASLDYPSFAASTLPTGLIAVPMSGANTFASGTSITVSATGVMREPNSANVNAAYYSTGVFAEQMASGLYSVTVGNAALVNNSQGIGAGMSNADGSIQVFVIVCTNTTSARIYTWVAGVLTQVGTTSSTVSSSASDKLALVPSLSGGIYTYTLYKNGAPTACVFTDSSAVIGVPGRHPVAAFKRTYSSGQAASPGIKSLSAALI